MKILLFDLEMFNDDYELKNILFEIPKVEMGQILKHGKNYYTVSMLSEKRDFAGVRKVDYNIKGGEKFNPGNTVCPYCDYENPDSWEFEMDESEVECSRCGSIFQFHRECRF